MTYPQATVVKLVNHTITLYWRAGCVSETMLTRCVPTGYFLTASCSRRRGFLCSDLRQVQVGEIVRDTPPTRRGTRPVANTRNCCLLLIHPNPIDSVSETTSVLPTSKGRRVYGLPCSLEGCREGVAATEASHHRCLRPKTKVFFFGNVLRGTFIRETFCEHSLLEGEESFCSRVHTEDISRPPSIC